MKAKEDTLNKPYIVEYYYKTRWGYADEFVRLYKKNHEPILKKQMEMGRILKLSLVRPRLHATEDGRWDFRVTIVWKNIQMTDDGFDEHRLAVEMFPDQDAFRKEEQRRFEILAGHWDLPVIEMEPGE
jgi:hypothetical protein